MQNTRPSGQKRAKEKNFMLREMKSNRMEENGKMFPQILKECIDWGHPRGKFNTR